MPFEVPAPPDASLIDNKRDLVLQCRPWCLALPFRCRGLVGGQPAEHSILEGKIMPLDGREVFSHVLGGLFDKMPGEGRNEGRQGDAYQKVDPPEPGGR